MLTEVKICLETGCLKNLTQIMGSSKHYRHRKSHTWQFPHWDPPPQTVGASEVTPEMCEPLKVFNNPLNAELNPICHLLALLGAHHFLHVSRIRVKTHSKMLILVQHIVCVSSTDLYISTGMFSVEIFAGCRDMQQIPNGNGLGQWRMLGGFHPFRTCVEHRGIISRVAQPV